MKRGANPSQQRAPQSAVSPASRSSRASERPGLSLQRAAGNRAVAQFLAADPGQPLDAETRRFMEGRFGESFAGVRLHTGTAAAHSALSVEARAYTEGSHVILGGGSSPQSLSGRMLLAHELAHVVQQRRSGPPPQTWERGSAEESAEAAARQVMTGAAAPVVVQGATGVGIARAALPHTGNTPPPGPSVYTLDEIAEESDKQQKEQKSPYTLDEIAEYSQQQYDRRAAASQGSMDPRHARGFAGEQGMGFTLYRAEEGWMIIRGPSGSSVEAHGVTTSGEDLLAYNVRTDELHIGDNKSYKRRGTVQSATAIDPLRNLGQNLDSMIAFVESQSPEALPVRQRVLRLLRMARAMLRSGQGMPGKVKLILTNEGGQSTGVSERLRRRGINFQPSEPGQGNRPGEQKPPLQGGKDAQRARARAQSQAPATAKVQPKVEPKIEPKVEPKVEPKIEPKVEPKVETKAEPKIEPKAEPKQEGIREHRVGPEAPDPGHALEGAQGRVGALEGAAAMVASAQYQANENLTQRRIFEGLGENYAQVQRYREQGYFVGVWAEVSGGQKGILDDVTGVYSPSAYTKYEGMVVTSARTEKEIIHGKPPDPVVGSMRLIKVYPPTGKLQPDKKDEGEKPKKKFVKVSTLDQFVKESGLNMYGMYEATEELRGMGSTVIVEGKAAIIEIERDFAESIHKAVSVVLTDDLTKRDKALESTIDSLQARVTKHEGEFLGGHIKLDHDLLWESRAHQTSALVAIKEKRFRDALASIKAGESGAEVAWKKLWMYEYGGEPPE